MTAGSSEVAELSEDLVRIPELLKRSATPPQFDKGKFGATCVSVQPEEV